MADISKVSDISIDNINALGGVAKSSIGRFGDLIVPAGGGFYPTTINQSCRFNDDDSAYLNWTPSSADTNRKKFGISVWFKLSNISANNNELVTAGSDLNNRVNLLISSTYGIYFAIVDGGSVVLRKRSNALFRDPSSWYHVLSTVDTTISSPEAHIYINGDEITDWDLNDNTMAQNDLYALGNNVAHYIGRLNASDGGNYYYWDGYMAVVQVVIGSTPLATDLGQFQNGVWVPKSYSGSYGTNGFYLDFSNSSDLGEDQSGNNNDFTSNNLAATDQVTDTPTNNFCVWNPLDIYYTSSFTLSEGNLKHTNTTAKHHSRSTMETPEGSWYAEFYIESVQTYSPEVGICDESFDLTESPADGTAGNGWVYRKQGQFLHSGNPDNSPDAFTAGDKLGMAVKKASDGTVKVWWSKNGVWQGSGSPNPATETDPAYTLTKGTDYENNIFFIVGARGVTTGTEVHANFGQDSTYVSTGNADENGYGNFEYSPPSGYLTLCSANLSDPSWMSDNTTDSPSDAFDIVVYGNQPSSITGLDFGPDIVWIKDRQQANSHAFFDTVRGALNRAKPDTNAAPANEANTLTSFNSDGFSLGTAAPVNGTGVDRYVAWNWLESATYGIDIVTYSGNGSGSQNISHNLGKVPQLIVVKDRSASGNWITYHEGMVASAPQNYYMVWDASNPATSNSTLWNNTAPTSTQFTVGSATNVNASGHNYIAYLFTSIEGFSKFGSYIGNLTNDGPFIWCGFRPAFVVVKNTEVIFYYWLIHDTGINPYNPISSYLYLDLANAEGSAVNPMDMVSNGFKIRYVGGSWNLTEDRYIYMAFAETPFKYANAR